MDDMLTGAVIVGIIIGGFALLSAGASLVERFRNRVPKRGPFAKVVYHTDLFEDYRSDGWYVVFYIDGVEIDTEGPFLHKAAANYAKAVHESVDGVIA